MKTLTKKMDKVKRPTNKFSSKSKKVSKLKLVNFQINSIHLCICDYCDLIMYFINFFKFSFYFCEIIFFKSIFEKARILNKR